MTAREKIEAALLSGDFAKDYKGLAEQLDIKEATISRALTDIHRKKPGVWERWGRRNEKKSR